MEPEVDDDVAPVSKPIKGMVFERVGLENVDAIPDMTDDWPLEAELKPVGVEESAPVCIGCC